MGDKKGSRKGGEGGNGKDCRSGNSGARSMRELSGRARAGVGAGADVATKFARAGIAAGVVVALIAVGAEGLVARSAARIGTAA